jgi:hypothetical protein
MPRTRRTRETLRPDGAVSAHCVREHAVDPRYDRSAEAELSQGIASLDAAEIDQACVAFSRAMDVGIATSTPDGLRAAAQAASYLGAVMEVWGLDEEAGHAFYIAEQLESAASLGG